MKKIISIGLLSGLVMFAASHIFSFFFNLVIPSVGQEYANNPVFRPWSDPLMSLIFAHPFILGIVLAWLWTKLNMDWLHFSFVYWLIAFPGMFISYSTFPISLIMVINWYLTILIQSFLASLVFARFLKNGDPKKYEL